MVAPSESLQMSMRDFVYNFVFNQDLPEDTDDSWEAQEKIAQALLARRRMLTGFLKLVMYKNVDLIHAAPILAQYMRVSGLCCILADGMICSVIYTYNIYMLCVDCFMSICTQCSIQNFTIAGGYGISQ